MRRPLFIGLAILLCAHALWLANALLQLKVPGAGAVIVAAVPVAAFLSATSARHKKFFVGLFIALAATLLLLISNTVLQSFGQTVLFPGVLGALTIVALSLPTFGLLAALGAGLANLSPFRPV